MTEEIYQNLVRSIDKEAPESIHLCDFPEADDAMIDKDLEANMEECSEVGSYGTRLQEYGEYQEPSADRTNVCESRF